MESCYCKPMCRGKDCHECKWYCANSEVVGNGKKSNMQQVPKSKKSVKKSKHQQQHRRAM